MPDSMQAHLLDTAAVVAVRDFATARSWYVAVLGREPDLEPINEVAEWQITDTSWLQLVTDANRAGKSMVRFGVPDLASQVERLKADGIATGEPVVIAGMVVVVDVADPDGNEVSFVQELGAEPE
jgi:catechol 2,3-dioxygenase-like lactoylglutathione lyase family enzyme